MLRQDTLIEIQTETRRRFCEKLETLKQTFPGTNDDGKIESLLRKTPEALGAYILENEEKLKIDFESKKVNLRPQGPEPQEDEDSELELVEPDSSDEDEPPITRNSLIDEVLTALNAYLDAEKKQQEVELAIRAAIATQIEKTNALIARTKTLLLALQTGSEMAKRHLDDRAYQIAFDKIELEKRSLAELIQRTAAESTVAETQAKLDAKSIELDSLIAQVHAVTGYKADHGGKNPIKTYGSKTERLDYVRGNDEVGGYQTAIGAWAPPPANPVPFAALAADPINPANLESPLRSDNIEDNKYDKTTINDLAIFTERTDGNRKPRSEIADLLDRSINPAALFEDVCTKHEMSTLAKMRRMGNPYPQIDEAAFNTLLTNMRKYNDPLNASNLMKHGHDLGIDNVLADALMAEYKNKMTVEHEGQTLPAKNIILLAMKQVESFLTLFGHDNKITIENGWSREYVQAVLLYCQSKNYPVINRTNHAIPKKDYENIPMDLLRGELGSNTQTNFLKYIESDGDLKKVNDDAVAAYVAREKAKSELFGSESVIRRMP